MSQLMGKPQLSAVGQRLLTREEINLEPRWVADDYKVMVAESYLDERMTDGHAIALFKDERTENWVESKETLCRHFALATESGKTQTSSHRTNCQS